MNATNNNVYAESLAKLYEAMAAVNNAFNAVQDAQSLVIEAKSKLPVNDGAAGTVLKLRYNMAIDQIGDLIQTFGRTDNYLRQVSIQHCDVSSRKEMQQ